MISRSKKKGVSTIEVLIAALILMVMAHYTFPVYTDIWTRGKASALRSDLKAYRQAIMVYYFQNSDYPDNLKILLEENYISFDEGLMLFGISIAGDKTDKDGVPIDPFGNYYYYDNETGEVSSTSEGYEDV